jgi:hypothetical protein
MKALRSLQRELQSFLLAPSRAPQGVFVGTAQAGEGVRLAIYADAYRLRLLEALEIDFPTPRAHVGPEAFRSVAADYIEACPPRHFSIRYCGERLAAFLRQDAAYSHRPHLAEMAEFDWAIGTAFDAPDAPVTAVEELASLPARAWPGLRLRLHPAVQLVDLHWNVPTLRQAVEAQAPLPELQPYPESTGWVVWRRELRTYFRSVPAPEREALRAVARDEPFASLCEKLCDYAAEGEVAGQAAVFLRGWVEAGMISSFEP